MSLLCEHCIKMSGESNAKNGIICIKHLNNNNNDIILCLLHYLSSKYYSMNKNEIIIENINTSIITNNINNNEVKQEEDEVDRVKTRWNDLFNSLIDYGEQLKNKNENIKIEKNEKKNYIEKKIKNKYKNILKRERLIYENEINTLILKSDEEEKNKLIEEKKKKYELERLDPYKRRKRNWKTSNKMNSNNIPKGTITINGVQSDEYKCQCGSRNTSFFVSNNPNDSIRNETWGSKDYAIVSQVTCNECGTRWQEID